MSTCQWETWGCHTRCDWRTVQENRNYSRNKRPPEEFAQTLYEHALHWGCGFQMQWRRKPLGLISFIMRRWDSSSTRASFYSLPAQADTHPLGMQCIYTLPQDYSHTNTAVLLPGPMSFSETFVFPVGFWGNRALLYHTASLTASLQSGLILAQNNLGIRKGLNPKMSCVSRAT